MKMTQQSAEREALKTADCFLFGGRFCVLKTLVGGFIGEQYALKQAAGTEPQQAAQRC